MARILVVDDDPDILKLVQRVLSHDGHLIFTAQDAMKAMDVLRETMFDLLISDANMPHVSGFDLVQTLRRESRFRHLGICMLTGLRERKDIDRAIKAGVDDYIVKPIDPILLSQKIHALFEKRPPADHPDIRIAPGSEFSEAKIQLQTAITAISELGITILTTSKMEEGATAEITADFFLSLGVEVPPMKVLSCIPEKDKFSVQLIFLGAREAFLQKIRAWIYSHGASRRSA